MEKRQTQPKRLLDTQLAVFKTLDYLYIKDILRFAQISKKAYNQVGQYLTVQLKKNGFIDEDQDVLENPYFSYSGLFGRDVILIPLQNQFCDGYDFSNNFRKQNFIRKNQFKGLAMKDFSMGIKFTVYHFYNNEIIVIRTRDYKNFDDNTKQKEGVNFVRFSGVVKYSVYARNLLFQRDDNLNSLLYDKSSNIGELTCKNLAENIENFWNGYAQLVIKQKCKVSDKEIHSSEVSPVNPKYSQYGSLSNSSNKTLDMQKLSSKRSYDDVSSYGTAFSDKQSNSDQLSNSEFLPKELDRYNKNLNLIVFSEGFKVMNNFDKLNPELQRQNKCFWVDIVGIKGVNKMVTTSANELFFQNEQGLIQTVNVKDQDVAMLNPNRKREISVYDEKDSTSKHVDKIFSGMHSSCKTRRLCHDIKYWKPSDVIEFQHKLGFYDFDNVITYDNINGKKLVNIDKNYIQNKFGQTSEAKIQRLLKEIKLVSNVIYKNPEVYMWGNNSKGQLALNSENNNIAYAKKSELPILPKNDNINEIKFGKLNTFCQTELGKMFVSQESSNEAKKIKKLSGVSLTSNLNEIYSDEEMRTGMLREQNDLQRKGKKDKNKNSKNSKKDKKDFKHKPQEVWGTKGAKKGNRKDSNQSSGTVRKGSERNIMYQEDRTVSDSRWFEFSKLLENHTLLKKMNPQKVGISLDYIYIMVNWRGNNDNSSKNLEVSSASKVIYEIKTNYPRVDLDQFIFNYNKRWMSYKEIVKFQQIDHVKTIKIKNSNHVVWNNLDKKINIQKNFSG